MRTLLAPLALTALLLGAIPAVQGQAPAAPDAPLLSDGVGDVTADVNGQKVPVQPADAWSSVDLVSLALSEDPGRFLFDVGLAGLGGDQPRQDYGNVRISFAFGETTFWVNLYRSADNAAYFGNLYVGGHNIRDVPVTRDLAASHLRTTVDRADLVDATGNTPGKGDLLSGIQVTSAANAGYTVSTGNSRATSIGDMMPDDGATASWTVLYRGRDGMGARLSSPQPFRSSNGDATTYEFEIEAVSEAPESARFGLATEGMPAGWTVQMPGTLVELPGGKPVTFPIHVTVPFAHTHGTAASFTLRLDQEDGDAWASLEVGVHYTAIPQPAGHHPELYLHSIQWAGTASTLNPPLGGSTGELFMNALSEDPADYGVPVEGWASIGSSDAIYHWMACLDPSLGIGLDFDLQDVGVLHAPMKTTRPLADAVLEGRLLLLGPGEPIDNCYTDIVADRDVTVLATLTGTAVDLASGTEALLEGTLTPTAQSDYQPYEQGAALVLQFNLTGSGPGIGGVGGASLLPGGSMRLPLVEYHDVVAVLSGGNGSAPTAPGFVAEPAPPKDSPLAGPGLLVLGLGGLALAFRRRA
ncbi:MAG TPA: hypothetical protein VM327_05705 [Candidatus Thermoplasmatota archaeon]|nr:hypothetical protein [Candidatus Thermoplasmatota archaeon]